MAVTLEQAAAYVGGSPDDPNLPGLLATATRMVDDYLRQDGRMRCPIEVHDHSILQLSSELYIRRNSPGGIVSWGPDGSVPARLASDAMISVQPALDRYRGLGRVG